MDPFTLFLCGWAAAVTLALILVETRRDPPRQRLWFWKRDPARQTAVAD
jgi:hypothetical protein